jgi:hypothetical protein
MGDPFGDAQFYQKTLVFKSFSTVSTPRSAANLERSEKFVRQQRLVRQLLETLRHVKNGTSSYNWGNQSSL